jgi:hypothetical protein
MKHFALLAVAVATMLIGCTSVDVRPIATNEPITEVVIRRNPKVAVDDFVDVLTEGFRRHGISSRVVSDDAELKDVYVVNYVAYRNWDIAPYLTDATISIDRNGRRVAEAVYHLMLRGGMSLAKWQGTKTKIDPVLDEMLTGIAPRSVNGATPRIGDSGLNGTQKDAAAVRVGMTEAQVIAALGQPALRTPGKWYFKGTSWVTFDSRGLVTAWGN